MQTPRSSLIADLRSGAAGVGVRLLITFAMYLFLAGVATLGAFVFAAMTVPSNVNYGSRTYVRVPDNVIAVTFAMASAASLPMIVWLWARLVWRSAGFWFAAMMTFGIGLTVAGLCAAIEESMGGNTELAHAGVVALGASCALLIWARAWHRHVRRRPLYAAQGQVNLQCPACGYSMVGLTEPRCPECGAAYTLDELIKLQDFEGAGPRAARDPDTHPPIARIPTGTDS